MNAHLCPDCLERACDCTPPLAHATTVTVMTLACDAYDRAGGDSVLAVLMLREAYRPLPGIDAADLIDRAQRWIVEGMGAAQRAQLAALEAERPRYLAIAEARYRRVVAGLTSELERAA